MNLQFSKTFSDVREIKAARGHLAALSGYPRNSVCVVVKGVFQIVNGGINDEFNLTSGWCRVTRIGTKNMTVYVPQLSREFVVRPFPGRENPKFQIDAEVLNGSSIKSYY